MCTRIFNTLNPAFPITFRNMDWPKRVNTHFFFFPANSERVGFDQSYLYLKRVLKNELLPVKWCSKYASIAAVFGDEKRGFATADGLNEKGLTVNTLYDKGSRVKFKPTECKLAMSPLRWGQYLLDCFSDVKSIVQEIETAPYILIPDRVPDNQIPSALVQAKAIFKICLSDASGDSAIIKYQDGKFHVLDKQESQIVSDQPIGSTKLMVDEYANLEKMQSHQDVLAQTRSLASFCALPLKRSSLKDLVSNSTTSTLFSSPSIGTYYFLDSYSLNLISLSFNQLKEVRHCAYLQLVKTPKNQIDLEEVGHQDIMKQLIKTDDPYQV